MNLKYVLEHEIERRQCGECYGMWFRFDHEGNNAYYRLSPVAPETCKVCNEVDQSIEQESTFSAERWIAGDEIFETSLFEQS